MTSGRAANLSFCDASDLSDGRVPVISQNERMLAVLTRNWQNFAASSGSLASLETTTAVPPRSVAAFLSRGRYVTPHWNFFTGSASDGIRKSPAKIMAILPEGNDSSGYCGPDGCVFGG